MRLQILSVLCFFALFEFQFYSQVKVVAKFAVCSGLKRGLVFCSAKYPSLDKRHNVRFVHARTDVCIWEGLSIVSLRFALCCLIHWNKWMLQLWVAVEERHQICFWNSQWEFQDKSVFWRNSRTMRNAFLSRIFQMAFIPHFNASLSSIKRACGPKRFTCLQKNLRVPEKVKISQKKTKQKNKQTTKYKR